MNEAYDLIVIGCGAAGLSAALSAVEAAEESGREFSVAILERSTKEERGGNTRWTGSYLRLKDTENIADDFVEDMLSYSGGRSDERYVRTLAENVPETIAWTREKGVEYDYLPTIFLTLRQPRMLPVGGGRAIVETLATRAEEAGVTFHYKTTAQGLTVGEDGVPEGVEVRGSDGRLRRLGAGAVVLASGGFEGNPEMMTRYIGRNAHNIKTIAKGGQYNKGEGIRMALELGAKAAGQWDAFHAEPADPRSDREEAVVMTFPYGILVNGEGERFIDEGAGTVDETYEAVAREILYGQDQTSFVIIDQKMYDIPGYEHAVLTDKEPYRAETVADLAEQIGVDPAKLEETLATYNEAASADESAFDALVADGLATRGDLDPPKSNWARRIDASPYLAYPLACANVFTFGGVGTNERAEVVSADDVPIPGLYAAGEMTGLYFDRYPGSTSVLRCLTFGKIAGAGAVRYVAGRDAHAEG